MKFHKRVVLGVSSDHHVYYTRYVLIDKCDGNDYIFYKPVIISKDYSGTSE